MARTKEGCEREKLLRDIKLCFGLSEPINTVCQSLVDELYWQIVKLKECRKIIDSSHLAVEFKQGKQDMVIQNPTLKTYNDLIKNQAQTIKSLQAITGKKESKDSDLKEFMSFLNGGKKSKKS